MTWVPFHTSLREGDKRGLPRAVRFVYLELSLLSRPTAGRLALPRGFKSDIDAVHDILGGDRREIRSALELLTVPIDPTDPSCEPMLTLAGPPERRVLTLPAHSRWVKPDTTAERVRRHRQREQSPTDTRACNGTPTVTETVSGPAPVTGQRRAEESREEQRRGDARVTEPHPTTEPTRAEPSGNAEAPSQPTTRSTAKTSRGARLSADWEPAPATLKRFREREGVDARACIERFKNHWLTSAGRNAIKLDWERAFMNWVLDDIPKGRVPAWEPEDDPQPGLTYGPPSLPPEGLMLRLASAGIGPKPAPDDAFGQAFAAAAAEPGSNVRWKPPSTGGSP